MSEASCKTIDENKRMRIRQFFMTMDDENINSIWNTSLKTAIQELLDNTLTRGFEELYRDAYTMVLHKHGEKLYLGTQEVIREHLIQKVRQHILESPLSQFLLALKSAWDNHRVAVVQIRDILTYMDRVYASGQRLEPIYKMGRILFRDNILRDPIIRERLQNTLLKIIDHEQHDDMIDKTTLKGIYQMLIDLAIGSRSVYNERFKQPFLNKLIEFYQLQSQKLLDEICTFEYIRTASTFIYGITQLISNYSDETTPKQSTRVLEDELITKFMDNIVSMIEPEVVRMFESNKYEELEILYKQLEWFSDCYSTIFDCMSKYWHEQGKILDEGKKESNLDTFIQRLLHLKERFNNFLDIFTKYDTTLEQRNKLSFKSIINVDESTASCLSLLIGEQLNKGVKDLSRQEMIELFQKMILLHYSDEKDIFEICYQDFKEQLLKLVSNTDECKNTSHAYVQIIPNVLKMKDIFDIFLKTASNEDQTFKNRLNSDLEYIINSNKNIPKYLSLFIHDKLQKIDPNFDNQDIILLDYLRDREAFERWYQWHLAQRFLSHKPMSTDMENNIILRLESKCSSQFTYQLKCMLKDILDSKTTVNNIQSPIVLSVQVLNTYFWPIKSTSYQCNLPQLEDEAYRCFENFYLAAHSGRRLTLESSLGIADLNAVFYGKPKSDDLHEEESMVKERKYNLQVSTHQMIILMLFNTRESYSFEKIHQQTNIDEKHLQRALLSLIRNRSTQSILIKEPNNNNIEPNDQFHVNDSFTSQNDCVKLKPIHEKYESNLKQEEIEDCRYKVDAAIVRIMKANRTMEHTNLITETISESKECFGINEQFIKRRIESLIASGYLSQLEDNKAVYNYVA